MRLREVLFGTALMSIALVTTKAGAPTVLCDYCAPNSPDEIRSIVAPKPIEAPVAAPSAPSPLISQDKILGAAYYDTVSILRSNNSCSNFFGGPDSVSIFNELVSKIRKDSLPADIGMRMTGTTINIHDARTKKNYRIFDKVSLNSRGSFYRRKVGPWEANVPRIGTFEPNTKQARVLMLLHELGHVMKGTDGKWLLPDDGKNEDMSRANSYKIEDVCNDQLRSLGKVSTMKDLGKYKDPETQTVPARTSVSTQPAPLR
jgi:hypothetical protein